MRKVEVLTQDGTVADLLRQVPGKSSLTRDATTVNVRAARPGSCRTRHGRSPRPGRQHRPDRGLIGLIAGAGPPDRLVVHDRGRMSADLACAIRGAAANKDQLHSQSGHFQTPIRSPQRSRLARFSGYQPYNRSTRTRRHALSSLGATDYPD